MKHIVFVIGNYKNGGVARRSSNLANEFGKKGYKVTILVTKEIGKNVFFECQDNVEVVSLNDFIELKSNDPMIKKDSEKNLKMIKKIKKLRYISRFFGRFDEKLSADIRALRKSEKLRKYLVLNPESILIPFGLGCCEKCFFASRDFNCKIIYAEKNAAQLECPDDTEKRKYIFNMLKAVDGAVLQTEDEMLFYSECFANNAVVIHNPVKPNLPIRYDGERRPVIVNFCRISEQKNLPLLISAFRRIHKEYPEYSLEIYGNAVEETEEKLRDALTEEIVKNGESGYIKILPPAPDVHEKIRDCTMFVSSSDFEGLSNSMIEALAIGMPCVCTDCLGGGAREMIKDGENGLLVPMKDETALYLAMKRLIDDKALSEKISENAVKIRNELSVEKIAGEWLEVIEKVSK